MKMRNEKEYTPKGRLSDVMTFFLQKLMLATMPVCSRTSYGSHSLFCLLTSENTDDKFLAGLRKQWSVFICRGGINNAAGRVTPYC